MYAEGMILPQAYIIKAPTRKIHMVLISPESPIQHRNITKPVMEAHTIKIAQYAAADNTNISGKTHAATVYITENSRKNTMTTPIYSQNLVYKPLILSVFCASVTDLFFMENTFVTAIMQSISISTIPVDM